MTLAEQVAGHRWWHSIDLGDGVVTPGVKTPAIHAAEFAALFDRVDLTGASVLDIGAWDGANCFEACRRGAGRVLATDSVMWAAHGPWRGRDTFELARAALGLPIEAETLDLMQMTPKWPGLFDVVILAGVFYHLPDPIAGLARAAALAGEVLIVETHADLEFLSRPAMLHFPAAELVGDPSNWWGPNVPLMIALLKGHGFTRVEAVSVAGSRVTLHAWRSDRRRLGDPARHLVVPSRSHVMWAKRQAGWRLLLEGLGLLRTRL
jgi:tRNA (mo5U34)-methyltransferase